MRDDCSWLIITDEADRPRHKPGIYGQSMDILGKAINIITV